MQTNWYYSKNGKAHGPKKEEDIQSALKTGEISVNDLIFKEGEKEWRKISEFPHFAKILLELTAVPEIVTERPQWILLKRNLEDTQPGHSRFDQLGPFQKDEILQKIRSGEAHWTDYIWKQGYNSWQKLTDIKEFNPETPVAQAVTAEEVTQPDFEIDRKAELLAQVDHVPQKSFEIPPLFSEEKPHEAVGENLAKTLLPANSETVTGIVVHEVVENEKADKLNIFSLFKRKKTNNDEKDTSLVSTATHNTEVNAEEPVNKGPYFNNKRIALYGGSFVVLAIVLSLSLFFSGPENDLKERNPQSVESSDDTQVVEEPAKGVPSKSVSEPVHSVTDVQEAPPAPEIEGSVTETIEKFVKILPLKLEGAKPQIVFESNSVAGEPINVKIVSKDGQILDRIRFEYSIKLARKEGEVLTLDLSKLAMPKGSYEVEASIGSFQAKQQIFIGQKNRQFKILLDKHNKALGVKKTKEKKELLASITQIEKLVNKVDKSYSSLGKKPAAWTKFYQGWSKDIANMKKGWLGKYKASEKDRYFYSNHIEGARNLTNDLFKLGKTLNEAVRNRRNPASGNDIKALRKKIKSLKQSL